MLLEIHVIFDGIFKINIFQKLFDSFSIREVNSKIVILGKKICSDKNSIDSILKTFNSLRISSYPSLVFRVSPVCKFWLPRPFTFRLHPLEIGGYKTSGIIPYRVVNGDIQLLIGIEDRESCEQIGLFQGKIDTWVDTHPIMTAFREFWEETGKLFELRDDLFDESPFTFSNPSHLKHNLNNLPTGCVFPNNYREKKTSKCAPEKNTQIANSSLDVVAVSCMNLSKAIYYLIDVNFFKSLNIKLNYPHNAMNKIPNSNTFLDSPQMLDVNELPTLHSHFRKTKMDDVQCSMHKIFWISYSDLLCDLMVNTLPEHPISLQTYLPHSHSTFGEVVSTFCPTFLEKTLTDVSMQTAIECILFYNHLEHKDEKIKFLSELIERDNQLFQHLNLEEDLLLNSHNDAKAMKNRHFITEKAPLKRNLPLAQRAIQKAQNRKNREVLSRDIEVTFCQTQIIPPLPSCHVNYSEEFDQSSCNVHNSASFEVDPCLNTISEEDCHRKKWSRAAFLKPPPASLVPYPFFD